MQNNDLISRAALIRDIKQHVPMPNTQELYEINLCIIDAPAVDAAPIVRCRDCKNWDTCWTPSGKHGECHWCGLHDFYPDGDFFCADGERADALTCGPDYCEIGGDEH